MADTIDTHLSRIEGAKSTIKTSIINKGVTVPATALIDEYHTYIDQIMVPSGNIELTTATATDVRIYATATVDGGPMKIYYNAPLYEEGNPYDIIIEKEKTYTLTLSNLAHIFGEGSIRLANNMTYYVLDFSGVAHSACSTSTSASSSVALTITPGGADQYVNISQGWQDGASVKVAATSFITYYTGSTDPSSSLGSDGDIYLEE